jgi:hypothetical protein
MKFLKIFGNFRNVFKIWNFMKFYEIFEIYIVQREALVVMVVWKLGLHLAKKSKSGEFDS